MSPMNPSPPLLDLKNVSKVFRSPTSLLGRLASRAPAAGVRAVDDVSFSVQRGEVVGLVGESGCGKSTVGRIAAGLLPASSGSRSLHGMGSDPRAFLQVQMIFQDPSSSLNPRMRVGDAISEAPLAHGLVPRAERAAFVAQLLHSVGLDPSAASRYPHQFSGGQRARIGIARALAVRPQLLVCDESVAALDVSIQAQILNLFMELRRSAGLTYLFISHDLGVIRHVSDRVVVMYLGRIVEQADAATLFAAPRHPYTQALLGGMPTLDSGRRNFIPIQGEIPSPLHPPTGCHFHPRCSRARDVCAVEAPALRPMIGVEHLAACHFAEESAQPCVQH